jgi:hypothetical protein
MPRDPYIREKFTRDRAYARKLAAEYFERFPKERYQTEVESWRELQWVERPPQDWRRALTGDFQTLT